MYDLSNKKLKRTRTLTSKKEKGHALSKGKDFRENFIK